MIDPKKNPKAKVPEVIKPHIKPDAPNTQPGDVGNGHVLVIDARHQKFNGVTYHLKDRTGYYLACVKGEGLTLHITVWTYHNGAPPKGYHIHHEHRNPDGTFDKNENNIEWLRLMTNGDHATYHKLNRVVVKRICVYCGEEFKTSHGDKKYCSVACRRRHENENRWLDRVCPVCQKQFRVRYGDPRLTCSDECEAELRRPTEIFSSEQHSEAPIKIDPTGETVTRICPICNCAFTTDRGSFTITCSPECEEVVARIDCAMKEQFNWSAKLMNLVNQILGVNVRAQVIDGEPWFVAKDVCDALNIENSREAVAYLDCYEKQTAKVDDSNFAFTADTPGAGNPTMTFVNEFGFCRLFFKSRKNEDKKNKRRLIREILAMHHDYSRFVIKAENALLAAADADRQHLENYQSLNDSYRQLIDNITINLLHIQQ